MNFRGNILSTLAFYDVLDFPLKAGEIFDYLLKYGDAGPRLLDIKKELDQLVMERVIGFREGFYFLYDREHLVPLRIKRQKIAQKKWRLMRMAGCCLSFVPCIKAVFASGSLAIRNTNELSDLDVLIVTQGRRIWLGRFLVLGLLSFLGIRRKGTDVIAPDKVCTSHFVSEDNLKVKIENIYDARTYSNLVPIFVRDIGIIERFKIENKGVLEYLSRWNIPNESILTPRLTNFFACLGEGILNNPLGNYLESLAKRYQVERIKSNPVTAIAGSKIIFNDTQLMFKINSGIFKFKPITLDDQILRFYGQRLEKLGLDNS